MIFHLLLISPNNGSNRDVVRLRSFIYLFIFICFLERECPSDTINSSSSHLPIFSSIFSVKLFFHNKCLCNWWSLDRGWLADTVSYLEKLILPKSRCIWQWLIRPQKVLNNSLNTLKLWNTLKSLKNWIKAKFSQILKAQELYKNTRTPKNKYITTSQH